MTYKVDSNITDALVAWIEYALPPGSCTEYLLRGDYDEAFLHAHPMIKPYWDDHILYVELNIPEYCRGENYDKWKGLADYEVRKRCAELVKQELDKNSEVFEL